ncbi:MAG: hypothetical protein ACLQAR_04885 [Steroidobacteraceae bacterium]
MIAGRNWLVLGAAMWAVASAGQPPARPAPPPPAPAESTSPNEPDEEFIEFLGADDHGDADWSELLKNAAANSQRPATPPPQDAKP